MDKPKNVLFAGPQDEEGIYGLLVRMWARNKGGWGIFYDPTTVIGLIEVGTRPDPKTRTDPKDNRAGSIGIIKESDKIVASVGLFIQPVTWFTTLPGLTELWLYVDQGSRDIAGLSRDLFNYSLWAHERMKADLAGNWSAPFPLSTGFMHRDQRFEAMERLWARRCGGHKVGTLFMVD